MPGHITLGQRKGSPATTFSLLLRCRFRPTTRVVGGRILVALRYPSTGSGTARRRPYIYGVHAAKIPRSPARELEEQTESTRLPKGRAGRGTVMGSAPRHTLQEQAGVTKEDSQPTSGQVKPGPEMMILFFRWKWAWSYPNYLLFSSSKRNSCSFSPTSLFATAGFTCTFSMVEF